MNHFADQLTFDAVCAAYTSVLLSQPGKALLQPDREAVFLENEELLSVTIGPTGELEMETAGCITRSSWDHILDSIECEGTAEVWLAAISSPVWVDLPT